MNHNADLQDIINRLQKTDASLEWIYFELVWGEPGFRGFQPTVLCRDGSLTKLYSSDVWVKGTDRKVLPTSFKETPRDEELASCLRTIVSESRSIDAILGEFEPDASYGWQEYTFETDLVEGGVLISLRPASKTFHVDRSAQSEYHREMRHAEFTVPAGFKGFIMKYYKTYNVWNYGDSDDIPLCSQLKELVPDLDKASFYFETKEQKVCFEYEGSWLKSFTKSPGEDHCLAHATSKFRHLLPPEIIERIDDSVISYDLAATKALEVILGQNAMTLLDALDEDCLDAQTTQRFIHRGVLFVAGEPLNCPKNEYDHFEESGDSQEEEELVQCLWGLDRLSLTEEDYFGKNCDDCPTFFISLPEGFDGIAAFFRQTRLTTHSVEIP